MTRDDKDLIKVLPIILLVMAGLSLTGCPSTLPPRVVTVEKPIPVPCLDKPIERPQLQPINPNQPDYDLALALWIDNLDRTTYIARLEAALAGCQ